jgi:hypothetical protein
MTCLDHPVFSKLTWLAAIGRQDHDDGCRLLAELSPPAFGITRPKPAGQGVPSERQLSGDEVGRRGTRTRPQAVIRQLDE